MGKLYYQNYISAVHSVTKITCIMETVSLHQVRCFIFNTIQWNVIKLSSGNLEHKLSHQCNTGSCYFNTTSALQKAPVKWQEFCCMKNTFMLQHLIIRRYRSSESVNFYYHLCSIYSVKYKISFMAVPRTCHA